MAKHYAISEEFRTGLLNYLGDRPYKEVAQAVMLLGTAPEVELPAPPAPPVPPQ